MTKLKVGEITHVYLGTFYKVTHRTNIDKIMEVVHYFDSKLNRWVRTFCYPPIRLMGPV